MIKQNEFQAYRKKNKTKSSHCYVKHTVLTLLLLFPLGSNAIDSTQKLRGKDNDLGHLSYESIASVIGLSTGEGERGPHLSHKVQKHFFEQAKMASDKNSTMNSTEPLPLGGACESDDDCESKICEWRPSYWPNPVNRCVSAPGAPMPNGAECGMDGDCETGRCNKDSICDDLVPVGGGCFMDNDCESNICEERDSCLLSGAFYCCVSAPGALMPNGAECIRNEHCESDLCTFSSDCVSSTFCCVDPSTTPPPSPVCFSSETLVTHSERGLIPISDINIGDHIQSNIDGFFSRVYAFKKNNHEDTEFYQLQSRSGTLLEVTDRHLVFLKNKSLPIAARDVRVGDVLKSVNPEDDTEVVKIELIHREGYYNPFTEIGTFVLNDGVVASSYDVSSSSSSDFFDGPTEMLHWHTLAHFACAPLRFVCKTMNFDVCSDADNQNEDGLHKFIVFLTTLRKLKDWQQVAVVPIVMIMGVLFTALELMYDKAEAVLEVASSTGAGAGLLTFSLVTALAVPGMLALSKRYFL